MLLANTKQTRKIASEKEQQITRSNNNDERQQLRLKLQQLSSKVDTEFHLSRSLGKLVQATRCKCGLTPAAAAASDEPVSVQVRPPLSPLPGQQNGRSSSIAVGVAGTKASNKPQLLDKRRSLIAGLLGTTSTGRPSAGVAQVAQEKSNTISSLLTAAAAARRRQKRSRANELRHNAAKFLFTLVALWTLLLALTGSGQAAPIGLYGVRPIWLSDGLMTVSDSSSADDVTQAATDVAQEFDRLEPEVAGWHSAQRQPAKRNEHFWIERRRLNRDRALEPPAWLRDRPIRRDQAMAPEEEDDELDQETSVALERARVAAQEPSRPIMGRYGRGRQSRESSRELYAELLRHLIEEALESRATLADFYDHLELAQQDTAAAASGKHPETGSGLGAKSGELKSGAGSAPADQTLVVAGDEISSTNTDDDTGSAPGQQQGAPVGSSLAVVQRLTPIPQELLKQQAGEYVRLPTRLELLQATGQADLSSSELAQIREAAPVAPPAAADEETFHVIEDIDRVVDAASSQLASDSAAASSPPVVQLEELEFESPSAQLAPAEADEQPAKSKRDTSSRSHVALIPTAVALIRSGFFERAQLIQLAGKLRVLLENSLQLRRNSIAGLFPINARQLLVELEPSRLDSLDRAQLAANFAYTRDSPELVLSWPTLADDADDSTETSAKSALSASENPIPILQAILESLNSNNNNNDDDDAAVELARFQEQKKFATTGDAADAKQDIWLPPTRLRNLDPGVGGEPLDLDVSSATNSWWNELNARPAPQQAPLAAIAAYLNDMYAQRERATVGVPEVAALTRQKNDTENGSFLRAALTSGSVSYVFVLLVALMSACMIVKLIVRKFDRRQKRRIAEEMNDDDDDDRDDAKSTTKSVPIVQTFWPFASKHEEATIKGTTESHGSGRTLNDANVHKLSADSGRETLLTLDSETSSLASRKSRAGRVLRNKLDSLGARWATFTSSRSQPTAIEKRSSQQNDDESSQRSSSHAGGFRTSTSYIKSLIEALTKSPASSAQSNASINRSNNDNNNANEKLIDTASSSESDEILTSQMDISAAHLILDYMEKHLVDKERLRREWLELNAGGAKAAGGKSSSSPGGGGGKKSVAGSQRAANQLILQRLARVALADENAHKNRDSAIVPFDRNRVRLGGTRQQHLSTGSPASRANNNNNNKLRNGGKKPTSGDYVNASFIHDDDPRRPTHIIAQGPLESTCGQFWQMIWEQEISVIVMLTRLNENGHQQCACYWPTNIVATPTVGVSPVGVAGGKSTDLRRGSVTSVFSGNGATGAQHLHQPIVAPNGELNDNVLHFEVPLTSASGTPRLSEDGEEAECEPEVVKTSNRTMKLEVHLISEHVSSSDYLVRNMYLVNGSTGESRTISQFHYLAWPCQRTPENVRQFLQFRRKVHKSYRQLKAPILVHCNDGAGRSGTYALIDLILERIKNGAKEIDLRATLEHLRDQRAGLCETQAQFEFVLVALAEEIQIILEALPQ